MKKFTILTIIFYVSLLIPLRAEIQRVVFTWNPLICQTMCIPLLEKNVRDLQGVTDFSLNSQTGIAELHWRPQVPFSFDPINFATRATGVRLLTLIVRVAGAISHDYSNVYLTSTGDGTRFLLFGPLAVQTGQYTIRQNVANYPMPPQLKVKLLEAERLGKIVTIEGPLLRPETYSLNLIAQQVNVQK